jgi:hypothetical protein
MVVTLCRVCQDEVIPLVSNGMPDLGEGISMHMNLLRNGMAITLLASSACPALLGQSVADAAREAREKKQKKQTDSAKDASAKPKVITNEDMPEVRSPEAKSPETKNNDSQKTPGQNPGTNAGSTAAASGSTRTTENSAHVDFKFASSTMKRPSKVETIWMVQNTSDHREKIDLKTIKTGPCNYHQETDGITELYSGEGVTNTFQAELTVLPYDCLGSYRLELRASIAGKLLGSASDTVAAE